MKTSQTSVLKIENLTKSFNGKPVLVGVDFEVYRGQIIGYIGPNGAGKSTTVKIMLGLIDKYNGKVEIFGQDIANADVSYKAKIGYVPENGEVYDDLTAQEYLTFVGKMYGMTENAIDYKAKRLMDKFGIYESFTSRISSFSKGMKQKLLIISSILHDPELLFFDEPLSGLDANSVMIVKELMAQLAAEGKTIFYSSHIMDVVEKISNRIILLADGKVIADGTFEQLKEKNEGTLEQIFNELTGFNEHEKIASEIVSIVHEGHKS
ncbi:ABC transporter ATP-binding protein [Paraliobacillus sp. PM-2]|uniref:ABC transporter ATP-binding protein n=1 Tax=Paraliobacillus sp. PM-2 TaxID=1462524 RepID=UPI000B80C7E8|nr:ABC transporter ATP-binding protein [Paraliobacillus sp. PM-2]